ncbi:hypothetical protein ABPG73_017597, partial [Tetrahymena malaccensis]
VTCVKKLQEDCLDEIFFESSVPLTKQNVIDQMIPFTTNQWFFTNQSNTYAQGCLMCNQSNSILTFQQDTRATSCTKKELFQQKDLDNFYIYCKTPLLYITYSQEIDNNKLVKPSYYEIITCQECKQNQSFDFNTKKCLVNCNLQIYGCEKCYNYNQDKNQLFQCTKCEEDLVPTQGGCQNCPDGCESCFEGDFLINFTRQLISMRPQNSLDSRLAQLRNQDFGMICTSCSDSYYFDYNKKKCIQVDCGEFCQDCYQYKRQSRCLSCDSNGLKKRISSILGYITDFYFQQIQNNIDQMINYNEEYNDCFICPISCKGCMYYKITNNPLSLYSAKCLGCNQNITGIKISDEYHWRYDQKNQKCLLCKKDDVSCYYEKKTEIYVTCGSQAGAIGQGLQSSPYNLQRAEEINWDKVIVNEVDFLRAVVIYNEIGLQKIDVKLNFITSSSECLISENIVLESNLMQKIFTLKELVLTIQTFANTDQVDERRKIFLGRQIKFVGFTDVNMYRIDWKFLLEDQKPTGFIFDTPYMQSIQIVNNTFSNPSGLKADQKNLFEIQIFNLQKQLIIQNVTFTNLTYQNFQLIKIYSKSFYETKNQIDLLRFDIFDSFNLTLNNLYIQNNILDHSNFISLSPKKLYLNFEDSFLFNNTLRKNSIFFLLDQKVNIAVISAWKNILIKQNQLESQFCFYVIQTFIRNEKKNIQFQENNIISEDIKPGIFQANKLWVQTFYLTKNTMNNQNIFSYLPQKLTKITYDPEYEEFDKQWEPIIDEFYDKDSIIAGQDKILFQLLDIYIQNNTMSRDGSLFLEITGQTNMIGKVNLREINFSCDNTSQKNQFQNIFQIKRIYQLFANKITICNNPNSKFLVLNDINILNINILDLKQEGDQNQSIRYPQIIIIFKYSSNGFLINSEQSQVILKDIIFNNNNALQGYSQLIIIANNIQLDGCSFLNSNFFQQESSNILTEIFGGAFYSQSSILKILKSSFTNSFSAKGGAIFWQPRYDAVLSIKDTQFINNIAQIQNKYSEGGAIYIESGNQNQLDIQLEQIKADNNLSNQNGGFLCMSYSRRKVAVLINKSQFSNNFAINGGIIYIDTIGQQGFLILDQVQIFYNLNMFAKMIQGFIQNTNNIKINEISHLSFRNLKGVEFKEVSVNSQPQTFINKNILMNQVLYQPLVQFQFCSSFFAVKCVFQDIVVFQTFIEVIQARQIFIQQTKILNIQNLKQYYINSLQNQISYEATQSQKQNQDPYLNIISDAQHYQQKKSSLIILDAIKIIQIHQSTFQKMICPDCYLGPLFLTSHIATLTQNDFLNNQGKNGGAINFQFSLEKYKQIFGSRKRLLLEKQVVQKIKNYKKINLELSNTFEKNLHQLKKQNAFNKARYLQEYKIIQNSEVQQLLIQNCIFQNNSAQNGGSVYLKNTYGKIQNSTFINNVAEGYGGAIFNEDGEFDQIYNSILVNDISQQDLQSDNQNILYNLEILSTLILYNKAKKVGGGYYSNNKYPNVNQQTTIYRNVADQYGSDQEVSPWKMSVIYRGQQLQKNPKIIIESGYIQEELLIYLLGRRNQQFKNFSKISDKKEETEKVLLEISYFSLSQNVLIQPTKIEFNHGIFNLTKKLQIFGTFGSVIHVNFTCSKIKLPIYDAKTQNLISVNDKYYFPITFQISDQCQPGTKIQKQDGKYDVCQICQIKSYSLAYQSESCHKCPLTDAYCYKDIILIPQGYWRKNNQSNDIAECRNQKSNCLGDLNSTDQHLNSLKKAITWQNKACAEGHIGALCEDCDLKAQYWIKTYQRVNMYSCADCTQVTYNWIFVILSNAGQVVLIAFVVFSSISYIKSKIYAEYLMKMKIFYFGSSFEQRNKSSLYIKILINYFQIISCLSTFRIDIPSQINFLYKTVGNPLENVLYAQDCLLIKHFTNTDLIYYRLFVSHAQIVFFITCLFLCLMIQSCISKKKMNCSIIVCVFNYCLYANLPTMVNLIIGTISCVEVGGDNYVKLFTSIECDQNHARKQKTVLWPLFFLWAVTIPLMQFLILVTKRKSLHTIGMKFSFGFLYNEYSVRCYWWEIVKTFQKIIIILVLNIYESKVIVKGCIVLAIVFMQMCLSLNQQPFLIADLNKTDFISSIVCCLTISLGIILNNYNQSYISQVIIYILVAIVNFAFLVYILKKICLQLFLKLQKIIQPCIKKLKFTNDKFELSQKRLQKLRLIIQNKIIFNQYHDFQIRNLQSKKVMFNQQLVSKLKVNYKKFKDLLLKIELKKKLQVKNDVKVVKKIKKRSNRIEIKANTNDKFIDLIKQKKQDKKSFLDMNNFMKTQMKANQKGYLAPSKDTQNHPQISIVDLDKVSQFKVGEQDQIRKEYQESQTTIFQNQSYNKKNIISFVDLDKICDGQKEDSFRKQQQESLKSLSQIKRNKISEEASQEQENSIYVKRRCILSMNIENFTQGDIQAYKRIKNLKYAALTEKQLAKLLFQQINEKFDNLKEEYQEEHAVIQHLFFQRQISQVLGQGQDCCDCKDAPPPKPSPFPQQQNQQNQPVCQCKLNQSYCITDDNKCIDLVDDIMWDNNIAAGVKKGQCFRTGDNVFKQQSGDYESKNQNYQMKTYQDQCVDKSNFDDNYSDISYCCIKGCKKILCLDKNEYIRCVDLNQLQQKDQLYYQDKNVVLYKQTLFDKDQNKYIGQDNETNCLKRNEQKQVAFLQCFAESNNNICYYQNVCLSITGKDKEPIGKTNENKCVFKDQYYQQINYCFQNSEIDLKTNYCIYQDQSKPKDSQFTCVNIDDNQFGDTIRGADQNGNCITSDSQQYLTCSFGYCKLDNSYLSQCVKISLELDSDKQQNRISSYGFFRYCGDDEKEWAVACATGYCIPIQTYRYDDFYSDQTQKKYQSQSYYSQTKCLKMNNQYFGKVSTHFCLNGSNPLTTLRIIECYGDYCIQTQTKGQQNFWSCVELNSEFVNQQVKLQDYTCSSYDSQFKDKTNMSSIRCASDFTNQTCLYQEMTSLFKCRYFNQYKYTDSQGQTIIQNGMNSLNFIGRAFENGTCQQLKDPQKSVYCDNAYCLNKDSICQPFDVFFVGKDKYTKCLEERDKKNEAILCENTHCLSNKDNNPNQNPNSDQNQEGGDDDQNYDDQASNDSDQGQNGWSWFSWRVLQPINKDSRLEKTYRILSKNPKKDSSKSQQGSKNGNQKGIYFCERISLDNNIIGVEKQSGSCIYQGDTNQDAQNCIVGEYCIQPSPVNGKNQCVPMEGNIICTDEQQNCLTIANVKQCKMCKKGQCLIQGNMEKPCLNFNSLGSVTCMAFDGTCQKFESRNCRACPQGTCLDLRQRSCIYTNKFKLKSNQCLKFKQVDVPCQLYDLDNYSNDPNIQCTNPEGRCINMLDKEAKCQSCPRFYNQPGDNKCYGLKEQNDILNRDKNNTQSMFSLNIIYVPINGCPQGCYKCDKDKWCTQCQYGYILYRNSDLKTQYCVLVNILNSQKEAFEINYKTNEQMSIQIQCDINSLYPSGREFVYKQDYFYCYYFLIKYNEGGILRLAKIFEETVILQLNNDQNTLQALSNDSQLISNNCLTGCITCQIKGSQHICLKCLDGFTLDFQINQCQKCPDQCISCFYGGLYNLQTVNWSVDQITLKSLDISKLSKEQYGLLCEQCESNKRLVLKQDFSGCELCGDNCSICSWGNQNYNLTNLFDLNQALYSGDSFLKIKKCVQCIDGYIFNIDCKYIIEIYNQIIKFFFLIILEVTCVKKLQEEDCLEEIFFESSVPLTKSNFIYQMKPFTTNQWFFANPNNTYAQGCLKCNESSSIITFLEGTNATACTKQDQFAKSDLDSYFLECKVPLFYIVQPIDPINIGQATKIIYTFITCLECLQNYSFDFSSNKCKIFCKTQIYGCKKCYNYVSNSDQLYQCTLCDNDQIATQGGCQDCPDGCQSCFEGDYLSNFTKELISMRPQNSLKQRLDQLQKGDISMKCTSCTDSYYFDYNKKKCVFVKCGEFCQQCYQYKKQSKCLSCNKVSMMKKISSILGYITDFYFQKIIKNIDQMINYNEEFNDCFICPLSCKGCLYYKLTNNPLSIYSAKCLGCNYNIADIKISDDYHWRYDQKNKKCLLCKKDDIGCYYEKQTELFVTCGSKEGAIGQGLMSSPYNLQRADEINWDKIIVSEVDLLRAVVIYNEIGLQKIDVKLNIIPSSSECLISDDIVIQSNLMQKVFTLKEFVLTIQTFNPSNPDQTDERRKIQLARQIKFAGFTDINIYRIDWKLLLEDQKPTGFIFDTPYIQSIQIINTTFSNPSGLNIYFKNLFDIQIFNLQKQFTISNVTFTNLTYQNFELIKMYQKSFYDSKNQIDLQRFDQIDNLNVTLDYLYLKNNNFYGSSFISFTSKKIYLNFRDSLLGNNYLGQNSIFFLVDQKINIGIISIWSNIIILQNVLESQFCFYVIQTFIRNEKKNIQFQENNITSPDIKLGIFQANKLWVQTLYLTKNTINNQNIFTYLPQKQTKIMYDPEYEELDKQWEPIIDKFYDYESTLDGSEKILFQLLDIYFQNNTMSRDGPLLLELTGQTKQVGKVNLREISFNCDNILLQNQFQNIFQIKRIYQLLVDRVVICNNQNSKFIVLNDINILNINTLDIKQEGDQRLNIRYPQIVVENANKYIFLRNIFMRKLLIQTCLIQIIVNTENQVSLNIINFQGQDNQLSIFDQSEEVNLISITSHSILDVTIKSSLLENNKLTSLKKIFKYSSNGFLINSEQSKVTLKDNVFSNNNALQGYSQLIIIANQVYLDSCSFLNSNFQQTETPNVLAEIQGGAFYCQSSILKISKSSFTQCFSSKGGAIYWQPRYDAVLSLNDSQFKSNIAQIENKYSEGGAIYIESGNQNQLDIQLNQVYADNNLSNQNGGFLSMSYFRRKVAVLINQSQLSNNFAINGGIISIDTATGSQGYLILDQIQIFYDLNIFAKIIQRITKSVNNVKPNEISWVSFKNLKSVEFKEVSVASISQNSIDKNILINQILYQPFIQLQFFSSFFAVQCVFQDIVVFQTFIEIIQAKQIFIQQTKFLNIQNLKTYYIKSLQNQSNSGMTQTVSNKQDYYLKALSNVNFYSQQKNSLLILDAIKIIQIHQSTFQNMVCPDCYLGPIFLTSQVATLTKNTFYNNQGKNGGAINLQYSLQKLMQQFESKNRLLLGQQIVENIKTYKMRNLELSKVFQNNLGLFSEHLTLRKERYLEEYKIIQNTEIQQVLIDDCQFQNNSAYNGGSIFTKNTYLKIQNSTFSNNLAEGYGGAIFNDDGEFDQIQNKILVNQQEQQGQLSNYKILYNVEILTTLILYNQAKKVGGAYYSNQRYPNMNQLTTIYRNIANQYGSDQEVSPWKMAVLYKGQQLLKNSNIILDSGYIQEEFVIYLLGRRSEQFKNFTKISEEKEELEQVFLEITYLSNTQNVLVQPLKIELDHGIFNLTKKLQIFGTFGSKIYVNLTCSKIKQPVYDPKTQQLITINENYYFPLSFQISDQCLPGTKVQKQDGKYDICQTCYLKTYSLEYQSQTCHKCPISDAYCYKNIILIPEGYWRKNNQSSDISECRNKLENCLGDLNTTDQNLDSQKKIVSWQNYACAEGHIGAFCEDCDLKAQYWKKSYQRVNMYSCADCTQVTYNWIFVILSNAGQVILIAIVVFQSINYIKLKIYAEYLMKMKLFYFGSSFEERNKSSLYIKILINYFQIISCLSTFRIDIPNQINFLYKTVGNPLENVLYAQDCLLIEHFMTVDLIYYRIFVSHAQIILFIVCLFICLQIQSCIQKTKINLSIIVCAINYCLYANLPSMVNLIIGTISCIQVGNDQFVKLFTSIECDSNHEKKQKMLLWPLLCLWAVVVPLLQFLILVIKRNSLHTISMKFSFGFLYNEYSEKCFWWEIVKTFQKVIIILVLNIYEQRVIVKGCIILAIVFMQMCFSLNQQPFLIPDLNKTDFISSIVCCLTISLGIILNNYDQSKASQIIIYITVAIINLAFIIFIARKILLQLFLKTKNMLQPLLQKFKLAGDKMQQIYKRLKTLRVIVEKKIIQKKSQQSLQTEVNIFNTKMMVSLKIFYKQFKISLTRAQLQNELQVKLRGEQLVKISKKRINKNQKKVRIGKKFLEQEKQKKQSKTSFMDMSKFVIKTQIKSQLKNIVPPQVNQDQSQNIPSQQQLAFLDSVQPNLFDLNKNSQYKTKKEYQASQTNILNMQPISQQKKEKDIMQTIISNRQSRDNSIDVKRKCILSFNITEFTQGDIQSFQRIKNLKYATFTEKQQSKEMFQEINQELDKLKSEYQSEQLVQQHISFQKSELKDFYKQLTKKKQYSNLICVLGNIQRYMNIEFNLY